jgi:hypothetical protein
MNDLEAAFLELRSQDRHEVTRIVNVTDLLSGLHLGQLVNYSDQGIMVMSTAPIEESSVFQISLDFIEASATVSIDLGVESLWTQQSNDRTCYWTGFYIIDISPESQQQLHSLLS